MNPKVTMGLRIVLGLIYFVFGLNGYFHFIPVPPMPEGAGAFLGALFGTPYFIHLLKPSEILAGALLLTGKAVPFALVWLAPITINIFCFHLFLAPEGVILPVIMVVIQVVLMWAYRERYKPLFR